MGKIRTFALIGAALIGFAVWRFWTMSGKTGIVEGLIAEAALVASVSPASSMELSEGGLAKIAAREGFSPRKYPDASGYSIGYGHFIRVGEFFSEPMTETTAREILRRDAKIATDAVRAYVKVPLKQSQFDALVSFVFNVGAGAFRKSTMLAKLNAGDYDGAAREFDRWHIPSIVIARRNSEKQQFLA